MKAPFLADTRVRDLLRIPLKVRFLEKAFNLSLVKAQESRRLKSFAKLKIRLLQISTRLMLIKVALTEPAQAIG